MAGTDEFAAAIPLIEARRPLSTLRSADRRGLAPAQGRLYFAVLSTPLELMRVPADALCFEVESELVRSPSPQEAPCSGRAARPVPRRRLGPPPPGVWAAPLGRPSACLRGFGH